MMPEEFAYRMAVDGNVYMKNDGSIVYYAEQVLGIELMPWQKEVLRRFEGDPLAKVRRVAAKYCPTVAERAHG